MIGATIAHYKVTAKLGQGGMGEVYRAADTKLDREVAIKVLPESFAQDKERLARFEREAKILASLDHLNIGSIYGMEDSGGKQCLILQLIEGETLTQRLRTGALPIDEALDVCKQIAEALEAAHEKGIIHRDLKPGNVKITREGKVKVLDFGLAKAVTADPSAAPSDSSQSPTLTADSTRPGVILGTPAYMSPEQTRAKPVDKRSDIWSFGCVLFECLTGHRLFAGDSATDSIGAVLHKEPDWTILPEDTPPTIQLLLRKCLVKDRKRRLHDIADARVDLEQALADPTSSFLSLENAALTARTVRGGRAIRFISMWAVSIILTAVITGFVYWKLRPAPPSPLVTRLLLSVEEDRWLSGHARGKNSWARHRPSRTAMALSPDGRYLVYAATDGTNSQLYLRPMDQEHARRMQGTQGASSPVFSPDGKSIGFIDRGAVKRVAIEGGEPRTIVAGTNDGPGPFGLNWGDDGTIILSYLTGGLRRVSAAGGTPERLTVLDRKKGETSHRLPQMLPGSKAVMFTIMTAWDWDKTEIAVQSLETDERTLLIEEGADPRYVPEGHLFFARKGSIMAIGFDPKRLETAGQPVRVIEDVMQAVYAGNSDLDTGAAQMTFSSSGTLAFAPGGVFPEAKRSLVRADQNGETQPFGLPPRGYIFPRWSPDGTQLAYCVARGVSMDVWIYDIVREVARRLTTMGNSNAGPVWSSDGKWIAFSSDRNGSVPNLYRMAADGTGSAERLTVSDGWQIVSSWSSEGVLAFVEDSGKKPNGDIWVLPPEGEAHPFFESDFDEGWPTFSPDGKWVAYVSNQSGDHGVYVRPYPGPDPPTKITSGGYTSPVWSRDGKRLYFRKGESRILVVDVIPDHPFKAGAPKVLFEGDYGSTDPMRNYDVDGEGHFVMVTQSEERRQRVTEIHVVLNWFKVK